MRWGDAGSVLCVVWCVLGLVGAQSALAQGALTPSGPPAPMMKTLTQVEPRTPISSLPHLITEPGSYYLTTNVTGVVGQHGITIQSGNVSLDLNGFSMLGVSGSLSGIHVRDETNIVVRNGIITRWGGYGIDAGDNAIGAHNCLYTDLVLSHNGSGGMRSGPCSVVKNCTSRRNKGNGIEAGLNSSVSDCAAMQNTMDGIEAGVGSTIIGCAARENMLAGIHCGTGAMIAKCAPHYNYDGISVANDSHVLGNNVYGNWNGIVVTMDANRIDGNNVVYHRGWGIKVQGTRNIIVRNAASRNDSGDYTNATGNAVGQVIDVTGGTTITATNPWANFSY